MVKGSLMRLCSLGWLVALMILCPAWAGEPGAGKDASCDTSTVLICSITTEDHALIEIGGTPQSRSSAAGHGHLRGAVTAAKTICRAVQTVVCAVAVYVVQLLLSVGVLVVRWFLAYLGAG